MDSSKVKWTKRGTGNLTSRLMKNITRNRYILPALVLAACLLITYFNWDFADTARKNDLQSYFEYRARDVSERIEQRVIGYKQILKSTQGLFNASSEVNRDEFSSFFNSLNLDLNYPGIQGVGFSLIIPSEQIQKHTSAIRKEGLIDYNLWPEGIRETYTSIIYLEPFKDLNLRAFGYDMYSEPVRRKAMETARDSNKTVVSGKVNLVQETGNEAQAGFLIYLPVYQNGKSHSNLQDRREHIIGWVYSPFRMGNFMEGIFGERSDDLEIEIYDGKNISDLTKMYSSKTHNVKSDNSFTIEKVIDFNDHEWKVLINYTPLLESRLGFNSANVILIVGFSITILLTMITYLLINKRIITIRTAQERKNAEDELKKSYKQVTKLNAQKDKFFSIIAHDLRSPFNGLIGLTELMAERTSNFSQAELIEHSKILNNAVKKLYKLLEYLLEWAQIQNGAIKFTPKNFELSKLVAESIDTIYERTQQKNIEIINEIEKSQKVYADENMIGTVLRNLLSNAVKFTRAYGKINIKTEHPNNGTVTISIEDNGVGIPQGDVGKLFKIEEKVSTQGTDGEASIGLGLLLCKEFIDIHEEKIWVESNENTGSKFSFTLKGENGYEN